MIECFNSVIDNIIQMVRELVVSRPSTIHSFEDIFNDLFDQIKKFLLIIFIIKMLLHDLIFNLVKNIIFIWEAIPNEILH